MVRLEDGSLWVLRFIDFEGAFTGVIVLEQTGGFPPTAVQSPDSVFEALTIFPNPSDGQFNLLLDLKENLDFFTLKINNLLGKCVYKEQITPHQGLNVHSLELDLPNGQYVLSIQTPRENIAKPLILQQ